MSVDQGGRSSGDANRQFSAADVQSLTRALLPELVAEVRASLQGDKPPVTMHGSSGNYSVPAVSHRYTRVNTNNAAGRSYPFTSGAAGHG